MQAFAMKIEDNVNNHWRLYRKNYKISTQECKYILHLEKHLVTEVFAKNQLWPLNYFVNYT